MFIADIPKWQATCQREGHEEEHSGCLSALAGKVLSICTNLYLSVVATDTTV
jgi:hypothetical protein